MDVITLAMVNGLKKKGGVGYVGAATIYPVTTVQCVASSDENEGFLAIIERVTVTVGETYTVTFDGQKYTCICQGADGYYAVGNPSVMGSGDDTGEPFVLLFTPELDVISATTEGTHTFSITQETIHQIDPKFIPGAVLQTVTLATEIPKSESVSLSAEDSALLTDAANKGSVFILAFPFDGTSVKAVPVRADIDEITVYMITFATTVIQFVKPLTNDGIWTVSSAEP